MEMWMNAAAQSPHQVSRGAVWEKYLLPIQYEN